MAELLCVLCLCKLSLQIYEKCHNNSYTAETALHCTHMHMHMDCELYELQLDGVSGFVLSGRPVGLDFTVMCNLNEGLIKPAGDKWRTPYRAKRKSSFNAIKKQLPSCVAISADSAASLHSGVFV